jgi:hypothetical protein
MAFDNDIKKVLVNKNVKKGNYNRQFQKDILKWISKVIFSNAILK